MSAYGTRVSRTWEPDDPELGGKRVQPFRMHELEHIPRDHRDIHRALLQSMPEALFEPGFSDRITEVLGKHLGTRVDLFFDHLKLIDTNRLRALIPGASCLVVLGLAPREEKLIVEVDLEFAYNLIGALLGTGGRSVDLHRPLTEIEQGVFLYVALKVVALLHDGFVHPEQLAIRLEDVRSDVRGAADILRTESRWLVASWKLAWDVEVGGVRVLIPESLARGAVLVPPPPGSVMALRHEQRVRERLRPFGDTPVEGWVETGRIELTRPDLEELEEGDIVLLEHSQVRLSGGVPVGPATMRIGLGQVGALRGELGVQGGRHVFTIQEIVIERVPRVHDPQEGHGEYENPEQVVAEYEDHADGEAYADGGYEGGYDDGGYEGYDEGDDGAPSRDDVLDEDVGLDDEDDDGDDEGYGDYEDYEGYEGGEYEEGAYEEGAYEEGAYEEAGYEEGAGAEAEAPVDDNLAEAGPLLGDIPMVVVVELGRVQLTADEVIRLRAGQLIELGRAPTDPVDLVVNGKLVAKGELVEIEGELGVKLVSLVKGEA